MQPVDAWGVDACAFAKSAWHVTHARSDDPTTAKAARRTSAATTEIAAMTGTVKRRFIEWRCSRDVGERDVDNSS